MHEYKVNVTADRTVVIISLISVGGCAYDWVFDNSVVGHNSPLHKKVLHETEFRGEVWGIYYFAIDDCLYGVTDIFGIEHQ